MQSSRARLMASGILIALIAVVALAAVAWRSSDARAARPVVTYSEETPAAWRVAETEGANGRERPGFAGAIVDRLAFGETVTATGRLGHVQRDAWREVTTTEGVTVWVLASYLEKVGDTTPPTTTPPTTTPPVTTPPTTTPPTTTPPTTTPPTTTPPTTVPPRPVFDTEAPGLWRVIRIANGSHLNVRTDPGTGSAVLARLDHDTVALKSTGRIASLSGSVWRQVEYRAGATGWVEAGYLGAYVAPPAKPIFATEKPAKWDITGLTSGSLNVRSQPGTDSPVVALIAHDSVAVAATGRTATLAGTLWREVEHNGATGWVSARFLTAHVPPPPPAPAPGTVVVGDWLGRGFRTPAIFRDGVWHVRLANSAGPADMVFVFGQKGDLPVVGDWDGNGTETPGVFRNGSWHLRNTNSQGPADVTFTFGNAGDAPVVGDWDGDGDDSPGVVRNGTWHLRNANSQGPADLVFAYGDRSDTPVVGDWDGDGTDSPGVVRGNRWLLRNTAAAGTADIDLRFGDPADTPVSGDWNGDGADTPGAVRGAAVHLRNRLSTGKADVSFRYELPA